MQFETFAKRLFFSLSTTTATATDALVRALKVETLRWNQNSGLARFETKFKLNLGYLSTNFDFE